jgi:hypothetical protein
MANEFKLLPNPTNIPEAVSTGYQRQNTNLFCLQTGLDTTEPYDTGAGSIIIPEGGIIELNGSLFKLTPTISFEKPDINGAYWIAVKDNGTGTADISLVTRPGIWNPAKKSCYTTDGARTLNFVSSGNIINPLGAVYFTKNTKGIEIVKLLKGWYYIVLASGAGGGNGGGGGVGTSGGGGVASSYNIINRIVFIDKPMQQLTIKIGGSGFNGGSGGHGGFYLKGQYSGGGGGGGSGRGEFSIIYELDMDTNEVRGGNGGNGGNGQNGGDSSGGGGGGGGGGEYGGPGGSDTYHRGGDGSSIYGGPGDELYGGNGSYGGNGGGGYSTGGGSGRSGNGGAGVAGEDWISAGGKSSGGGGGGMGSHGRWRPDGSTAAGYCNIYKLED